MLLNRDLTDKNLYLKITGVKNITMYHYVFITEFGWFAVFKLKIMFRDEWFSRLSSDYPSRIFRITWNCIIETLLFKNVKYGTWNYEEAGHDVMIGNALKSHSKLSATGVKKVVLNIMLAIYVFKSKLISPISYDNLQKLYQTEPEMQILW